MHRDHASCNDRRRWRRALPTVLLALVGQIAVVGVPAAASASAPATHTLRVMQWNMWFGGTNVDHYRAKQLRQIDRIAPDVLTLQETYDVRARQLGRALGWDYYQASYSLGIVSRFPILERYDPVRRGGIVAAGVRIDTGVGEVNVWTAHLGYTPYGPYDACFEHMTLDELRHREHEARRPQQLRAILEEIAPQIAGADSVPVLLDGDFNAPSHLDWTDAAAELHCGYGDVAWPTSVMAQHAGLTDSYREAHPDPVARPGSTWSPVYPRHHGATGRPEPQDRIDYLLYAGESLTVRSSRTYVAGSPQPYGEHQHNAWTSDHAAVITTYAVG